MTSTSDKPYLDPRLPSLAKVARILQRDRKSLAESREYNQKITEEDLEQCHLAGLKRLAIQFSDMAGSRASNLHMVKMIDDCLAARAERNIKKEKNALIRRNLDLLEAKVKALQEIARDRTLPDTAAYMKAREIFFPTSNGNHNGQTPRLLENGLAS